MGCDKVWQGRGREFGNMWCHACENFFITLFIVINNLLRHWLSKRSFIANWVKTVHCYVWNAYDDEWMHLCIYLFMCRWITSGWLGNYGAEVSKMHTVGGYSGLWYISDRGFSHVWQREGGGQIWSRKVWHIYWMAPNLFNPINYPKHLEAGNACPMNQRLL